MIPMRSRAPHPLPQGSTDVGQAFEPDVDVGQAFEPDSVPGAPGERLTYTGALSSASARRLFTACLRVAGILFALTAPAQAHADQPQSVTLNQAVADIARVVAKVVKAQSAKEIVVNPITDTGDLTHTSGPGVTEKLIGQLRKQGLEPALKAELSFTGSYAVGEAETDGKRQGFAVAKIMFQVKRRNGKVLLDSERDLDLKDQPRVTNPADIQAMAGGTVFVPPAAPAGENDRKVLDALDNQPGLFEIDGTKIRPKGAPYAIEMLVAPKSSTEGDKAPPRSAFQPGQVIERDGFPFLKVEPGAAVALRIFNDADHEVATTVTIDGLSMFAFRDNKEDKSDHIVIDPHSAGDVLGWFRNDQKSSVFLVSDLPRDTTTAEFLKNPAKIGSITVTFAAAWEKDVQKPADEPATRQGQIVEIVPGAPINAPFKVIKRHFGVLRAAVTVRYDKS
jgi:hypothetical protein